MDITHADNKRLIAELQSYGVVVPTSLLLRVELEDTKEKYEELLKRYNMLLECTR